MPRNRPAADVHQQDDDAGDRVAADEPARPVHRPEEVRLAIDLVAAAVGLVLVDQPGVQVGVDRHLPAGKPVEREPRGHFADTGRPLGDHHELDHDQDREQDHADDHLVAGHERAERADHAAGRIEAVDRRRGSAPAASSRRSRPAASAWSSAGSSGNALNSCGVRIASVVKSTTTATVKLAESKTSSNAGGIGTTNTRIAPMIVTGRTNPRRKPPPVPAADQARRCGRHPSPSTIPRKWHGRRAQVLNAILMDRLPCLARSKARRCERVLARSRYRPG